MSRAWQAHFLGRRLVQLGRHWHPRAVTAIRVDSSVSGCSWFASGTDLCIAGWQGLYRFSLQPPPRLAARRLTAAF
jgi:hypothetical protein